MRIDAHQHFWRYNANHYPWIPPGSPLHRDWLPTDLEPLLAASGLSACIAVQARQTLDESRWLLELADHHSIIKGVVGWVDLRSPKVEHDLAALASHPKFCGVRHVVQDEPDPEFMLSPDFLRGIGLLKNFHLTYDLLIYPSQLPAAIQLVHRFPQQPFVLDHLAKPPIRDAILEPWQTQIRELAKAPNVLCKVSGMVTEADHAAWQPAHFQPYLEIVFEAFGEDRLMYGSDWPVCLLAANYPQTFALIDTYTQSLSPSARAKFFGINAARCYRLQ